MTDWNAVLRTIAPKGKGLIISGLAAAMPRVIEMARIDTPLRQAHFLAQVAHESDGFRTTVEYASGEAYEGRNLLPNGRVDLGNSQPGDGKRFKGRGLIQETGRANYTEASRELGVDFIGNPDLVAKFPYAALTAALYWKKRAINADADADNLEVVSAKINGRNRKTGKPNGLAQRGVYLKTAKRALATPAPTVEGVEAITSSDLRKAGSRTIAGADQVKTGLGSLATAAGGAAAVASQVQDVAGQVQSAADSVSSTASALTWAQSHWQLLILAALLALAGLFAWRIWRGASLVQRARVDDANSGLNVGR